MLRRLWSGLTVGIPAAALGEMAIARNAKCHETNNLQRNVLLADPVCHLPTRVWLPKSLLQVSPRKNKMWIG